MVVEASAEGVYENWRERINGTAVDVARRRDGVVVKERVEEGLLRRGVLGVRRWKRRVC